MFLKIDKSLHKTKVCFYASPFGMDYKQHRDIEWGLAYILCFYHFIRLLAYRHIEGHFGSQPKSLK